MSEEPLTVRAADPLGLTGADGYSPNYRQYLLIVFMLTNACSFIDRQILTILLVPIKAEFRLSDTELGFLSGVSFALFFAVMGLPIGWLADRVNRRNLVTIALGLFSGMTVLSGAAVTFWQLSIARMGVGVGEAGITPSIHSTISDIFPVKRRATAISWYAAGISVGSGLGLLIGGWATHWFNWRLAFLFAGIPGLILALVVRFTLREPIRGGADAAGVASPPSTNPFVAIRFLWSQPAFRHLAVAGGLASTVGNGFMSFLPTFLARSFSAGPSVVGSTVSVILAVLGCLGTLFSGRIVDYFSRDEVNNGPKVEAFAHLIALPVLALLVLQQHFITVLAFFVPWAFLGTFFAGPTASMVQSLAPARMRASAAAFMFLIFGTLGNGVGPQLTGILSDLFTPMFGRDALRYALLVLSLIYIWSALHYFLASRTLKQDCARALVS